MENTMDITARIDGLSSAADTIWVLLAAMGRHLSGAQESVFSLAAADAAALAPPVGTPGPVP